VSNACAVEAALAARCSGVVPVAAVVAADPDGAVAGEPCCCRGSSPVPGRPGARRRPWQRGGRPWRRGGRPGHAVGAALAAIGTVRFERPGFFAGPDLMPAGRTDPTDGLPASSSGASRPVPAGR